ncbi:MAG TPA: cysteine desulfurase [Bacteroidia bacterium]|nr:cysteine desulfurase [Bacteroidia bacterium]
MNTPVEILKEKKIADFDVQSVRKDFPILSETAYGKPLIYFDNAATSQKPQVVIDSLVKYYSEYNANIHRGVHYLSQKASQAYDDVRVKVQKFINAKSEKEIIFTRGTTESINLVASSWGRKNIIKGDEIIISAMEHHSNIVPWQMLCEEKGAVLKVIPMNDKGELLLDESALGGLLSPNTKFISIAHTSNSLGTINLIKEMIGIVRKYSLSKGEGRGEVYIPVMIDGAQAVVHDEINVQEMDCDFFAFSGHKMFGPTGAGVLYGKLNLLEDMPPYQGGGEMIHSVSFEKTTYNEVPFKFEAGTPNVADVIALGTAIDYIQSLDRKKIAAYEHELMVYASGQLQKIPGVKLIGTAKEKASIVSFIIEGVNALDAGMYLDTLGVAVRTGHHCTEPVMKRFNIPGTLRASFLFYNTKEEIDAMVEGVRKAIQFLKK